MKRYRCQGCGDWIEKKDLSEDAHTVPYPHYNADGDLDYLEPLACGPVVDVKTYDADKVDALLDVAKKALEFYGDTRNHIPPSVDSRGEIVLQSNIENDEGAKAREALERMKAMENE
jgi:hypothetical protein